jgi:DNA polymerase
VRRLEKNKLFLFAMSRPTKDEIKSALIRELELLEAEGVESVNCDSVPIQSIGQCDSTRSAEQTFGQQTTKECGAKESDPPVRGGSGREKMLLPDGDKSARWNYLRNFVLHCPICNSHVKPGKKVVFGVGNLNADIFFCGEAPGADEEIQGEPFVGRAGQVLTRLIGAMGLNRSDVYIGNIMNWRPEMPTDHGNRPPTQEEMEICLPYLLAQLEIVQPRVVVALGATAVHGLLGHDPSRRMCDVRGCWYKLKEIPMLITYHPSFLLRSNINNPTRIVWEDLMEVMKYLSMPISEEMQEYFL